MYPYIAVDYYFLEDIDRSVNASVRTRSNITGADVKCRRKVCVCVRACVRVCLI